MKRVATTVLAATLAGIFPAAAQAPSAPPASASDSKAAPDLPPVAPAVPGGPPAEAASPGAATVATPQQEPPEPEAPRPVQDARPTSHQPSPAPANAPAAPEAASPPSQPIAAPPAPPPSQPAGPAPASGPSTTDVMNNAKLTDGPAAKGGVSPAVLRAEVMLDRVHDSPGVIDGKEGTNFVHALEAFEAERHLKPGKALDQENWAALLAESGGPVLKDYVLTPADVAGPFFPDLPKDYAELAKLKTIGYRSLSQKIGAQFHMGEDLLGALNPGVDLSKAGTKIVVVDLSPMKPLREKVTHIIVDKSKSQVFGFDAKNQVIIAVPATIGSRELPSPSGTYKVRGVAWNPIYYYDPKNFVQGDNKGKLKLPPGPNNPVGLVFIALSKPTYGLHGTPDPSTIDKTASHGCVRMTNWDAAAMAHLVKRGVVVKFVGK